MLKLYVIQVSSYSSFIQVKSWSLGVELGHKFHNDSQLLRVASGQHTMGAQCYIYVTVVEDLYENFNAQYVNRLWNY